MPASSAQPPSGVDDLLSHFPLAFNPGKARVHPDHKRIVLTTSSNAPEGASQPSLSPENARPISTSVIRRRPANQGQPNPPNSVSASLNGSHVHGYSRTWARTTHVDYGGALWGVPFVRVSDLRRRSWLAPSPEYIGTSISIKSAWQPGRFEAPRSRHWRI